MARPQHDDGGRRRVHWPRLTRDGMLFGLGAAAFINEVFVRSTVLAERLYIIAAALAMMGLPSILRLDERRRGGPDDDGP